MTVIVMDINKVKQHPKGVHRLVVKIGKQGFCDLVMSVAEVA